MIAWPLHSLQGRRIIWPRPLQVRAGAAYRKKRLLIDYFPAAAASGASHHAVVGLGAFALAAPALFHARNLDVDGQAAHRIFETDLQVVAQVFAALGTRPALLARSGIEHVAEPEHVVQDVAQVGNPLASKPPPAAPATP